MSEQDKMIMVQKIRDGVHKAQRLMIERKVKLGESVVIADSTGQPMRISAKNAQILYGIHKKG